MDFLQDQSTAPLTRLDKIITVAATPSEESVENIKTNIVRDLPWVFTLPEFMKVKGPDKKIALIGGGPSVANYVDDIKQFKTTIVCGSPNDWAMENGIIPTYAANCDPDPICKNYFKHLDNETKYLVATCCSPSFFEHLKGKQIVLWNCHSTDAENTLKETIYDNMYSKHYISGGCTVGLRSLSLAIALGYTNIHMFGFDSCMDKDKFHAYDLSTPEERAGMGTIHKIRLGSETAPNFDAPEFYCAGYQLAQAENFRNFYGLFKEYFTPTIYGNGLLANLFKITQQDIKTAELKNEKQEQTTIIGEAA